MALSLREAVFICQDSELRFRRTGWTLYSLVVDRGKICWEDRSVFELEAEDILADDYEIVRPNGTVARMPDPQGPASREPG